MKKAFNYNLYFDARYKPKDNGEYPIKLKITEKYNVTPSHPYGKTHMKETEEYCSLKVFQVFFPEYLREKNHLKISLAEKKKIKSEEKNIRLEARLKTLLNKVKKINEEGKIFTYKDLKKELGYVKGGVLLREHYEKEIKEISNISYANQYRNSLKSLLEFNENEDLTLFEITASWLRSYEQWCRNRGCSIATIQHYLKPLITIISRAVNDKSCPFNSNPFANKYHSKSDKSVFHIKKKGTRRNRYLNDDDLNKLINYKGKTFSQKEVRDLFLFSYWCGGMNLKDMLKLEKKNIDQEKMDFQFSRSKNKNKSTVRESLINLDQDSYSIIKTYEGSGKYAFKYLDNASSEEAEYRLIKNLRSKLNKQLKEIAKAIDIDRKLHFQMARHTCFSNLLKKGTSLDMIRQIAGHRDMKTTLNYVSGFETEDLKEELKKLKK